MALENKLGITDSAELAREEERISKTRALELFEQGLLDTFEGYDVYRTSDMCEEYPRGKTDMDTQ